MASRVKPKVEPDEGDEGDARSRTCAVTRTSRPVDEMVRFVADMDGRIVADVARKLPGRGVWVEARAETIAKAVATRAFSRSLKRQVEASADLPLQVEQLLRRRALALLSIANKAGELICGFSKVEALISSERPFCLIHASDAAADGCRKLDGLATRLNDGQAPKTIQIFTSEELSLALGRSNVIHAALTGGGASLRLSEEIARLANFRPRDDGAAPS